MSEAPLRLAPAFIGAGCNRDPNALDWNRSANLLAYAAGPLVVIYNAHEQVISIVGVLRGHKADVNCVRWVPQDLDPSLPANALCSQGPIPLGEIISADVAGEVRVWTVAASGPFARYTSETGVPLSLSPQDAQLLTRCSTAFDCGADSSGVAGDEAGKASAERGGVVAVATLRWSRDAAVFAASTGDGPMYIYARSGPEASAGSSSSVAGWVCVQKVIFPAASMVQCIALQPYTLGVPGPDGEPTRVVLLVTGSVDSRIRVFVAMDPTQGRADAALPPIHFHQLASLEWHLNWVRALSFCSLDASESDKKEAGTADTVLLASAAQDNAVCLWRFSAAEAGIVEALKARDSLAAGSSDISSSSTGSESSSSSASFKPHAIAVGSSLGEKGHLLAVAPAVEGGGHLLAVRLEAVLIGHESWVSDVDWRPLRLKEKRQDAGAEGALAGASASWPETRQRRRAYSQSLELLSASTDKTMMVWAPAALASSQQWITLARMGEVGGHTYGFYGCRYGCSATDAGRYFGNGSVSRREAAQEEANQSDLVMALGYTGCFHMWRRRGSAGSRLTARTQQAEGEVGASELSQRSQAQSQTEWSGGSDGLDFAPVPMPTSHNAPLVDVQFAPPSAARAEAESKGGPLLTHPPYLVTMSKDQTTRVFAPWLANPRASGADAAWSQASWVELARSQVHGWDLVGLAMVRPHLSQFAVLSSAIYGGPRFVSHCVSLPLRCCRIRVGRTRMCAPRMKR